MDRLPKEVRVPGILMDLIPQYLANRKLEVAALESAVTGEDFLSIQSIGHKLKGNAGSYGFYDLTDLGEILERAGKTHDLNSARSAIFEYRQYLENVQVLPA